ncbi:MAG: S41 family peptidase [Candidatus Kariarchaeaceae archaeon]
MTGKLDPMVKRVGEPTPIVKRVVGSQDQEKSGIEKVKILDHNIGYIKMTMINSRASLDEEKMLEALERFSSTTALIFDLRECRGGHGDMVHHTQNFLFGYEEGDSPIQILEIYFRPQDDVIKRMAEPWTYGNSYKGKPVYVLVSSKTGSGAEDFAFSLKITKRATLIGETTAGAGHPTSFHPITDDILFMCSIGRAYDPKTNKGWETTGVTPHIEVNPDLALDKAIELISK